MSLSFSDTHRASRPLEDGLGRRVSYLRLSLTDRCDLRCVYCMPARMRFLPKADLLTLEELDALAGVFIERGVKKIRLTGGEPLVRRDALSLIGLLSRHLESGALEELTLTTNGTQLRRYAGDLYAHGVRRVNVSLDTRDGESFREVTRGGSLLQVLEGIDAAQEAGLGVKINMVALKGVNEDEIEGMLLWAHGRGMDLTLIEAMPMSEDAGASIGNYLPLSEVRGRLEGRFSLRSIERNTGGPAHYVCVEETGGVLGFIAPLTGNFCASCNRVRVTCTGRLYTCLGRNDGADLREVMRGGGDLNAVLDGALLRKSAGHGFAAGEALSGPGRSMSVTGG